MRKQFVLIVFLTMSIFYSICSCSIAGELFSNGADLGKWWLKSSKSFDTMPKPVLYHLVGKYSFTELDGNADVTIQNVDFSATFRKNIFTSQTIYGQKRAHTKLSLGQKKNTTFLWDMNFIQVMTVDIIPYLSFQCGAMWEQSTKKYLTDRYTYFGGLLTRMVFAKYVNFSLGAYLGYDETTYDNDTLREEFKPLEALSLIYSDIPKYKTNGLRIMNQLSFPITKAVYFMQSGDYMSYFENSDYYHWTLDFTVNFTIIKGLSFFVKYKMDYENNIGLDYAITFLNKANDLLTAYNKKDTGNIYKDNNMFVFGIQVSL